MSEPLKEIDEWCARHKIPLGHREELMKIVRTYGENMYQNGVEDGRQEGSEYGYEEGKQQGYNKGYYEGREHGYANAVTQIEMTSRIPYEEKRKVLRILRGR